MANYKSWKDVARQQGISLKEDKILDYKLPTTAYKNKYTDKMRQESTEVPAVKTYEQKKRTWQQIAREQGMDVPDPVEEPEKSKKPSLLGRVGAGLNQIGNETIGGMMSTIGTGREFLGTGDEFVVGKDLGKTKKGFDLSVKVSPSSKDFTQVSDKLLRQAGIDSERGKQGLGPVGGTVYDVLTGAGQMGADIATSAITGAGMLPTMGFRAFGQSASEARAAGANLNQQVGYGALSAGIELGTEKLFGGPAIMKKLTGAGIADNLAKRTVGKLGQIISFSPRLTKILSAAGEMAEEGIEEVIAEALNPVAKRLTYDPNANPATLEEMAYAGLLGAGVAGVMGGAGNIINNRIEKRNSKAINQEYEKVVNTLPEDSPIMERVNEFRDNKVKVTDEAKIWVINQARQQQNNFTSETDRLIKNTEPTMQTQQEDNKPIEQTFKSNETFVKTQNNVSPMVQRILTNFGIENINNAKEVKQNIYNFYKNSVISDSNTSKPIMNKNTGLPIEVSRATVNQTFQVDEKYAQASDNEIKVAAMSNIVDLIQNGTVEVVDKSETPSSKTTYANLTGTITIDNVPYSITLDVRRTDNGSKYFVHSLHTEVQETINKPSGIINNGVQNIVKQNDPVTYDILDRIGQATGIKIRFVQSIDSPDGTRTDIANGQYDPSTKTLDLSMKSENPLLVVAKHEITHMLQQQSPKLYREYKDFVISTMQEASKEGYEARFNSIKSLHERAGLEISKREIEDEIVADATELFLTNQDAINALAKENPTLGQKILDIIREFIKKVDDAIQGTTSKLMSIEQLRTAEQLWVNALNDVIENKQGNVAEGEAAVTQLSIKNNNILKDESGKPLIVYHGTNSKFDTFDEKRQGKNSHGFTNKGYYFTNSQKKAKYYAANAGGGKIVSANLIMTNPIILQAPWEPEAYFDRRANDIIKDAIAKGHDGIIIKAGGDINGDKTNPDNYYAGESMYVVFEPEQIKQINDDNLKKSNETNYSLKKDNVGYHAGDLGKAESYWNIMSGSRGTGHFGTGTYFVGDKEQLIGSYKKRPQHAVDFSKYNLFKPYTKREGLELHEYLKNMNYNLRSLPEAKKTWEESYDELKRIEKAYEEMDYIENWQDMNDPEAYKKYKSILDKWAEDYKGNGLDKYEEGSPLYYEAITKLAKDKFEKQSDLRSWYEYEVERLSFTLNVSKSKLYKVMDEVYDEVKDLDLMSDKAQKSDSISTRIMKKLGYDGIDVRGIEGLDNTAFGSVIYDVDKASVQYSLKDSKERELSKEQQEYFKDSKVRDSKGNLLVMYHGTPQGDFTKFKTGSYFTQNKEYADNYQSRNASSISFNKNADNPKTYEVYLNIKKPFDTRKAKERRIFNEEYYGKYGMGTSLMKSGLPDWFDGMDLQEFLEEKGYDYDGLILDEGGTGGYGQEVKLRGYSYVVFDSNQVKSINNLNPTSDEDIRYQLKDTRDSKEVERLKKVNENLKEQFTLTKGVKLDKNAIKKLSRSLIKDYNSKYDRAQLETRMIELYAKIANNQIEYEDMEAETKAMARDIIENASVLNDTMHKQYSELRNTLRNIPITIAERYQKDFDVVGGFKAFKKRNLSRIKLSDEGMEVDQLYQELVELYPELFNADVANPADQLMLIEDVLSGLVPIYENPFNQDMNEVVEYLAVEIFEDFASIPEARATFADRKKAEIDKTKADNKEKIKVIKEKNKADIDWIKYQNKEKISKVLDNEKAKRDKEVDKLKKRYSGEAYKTWWKNKLKENDIKSHYQEMLAELRTEKNEKIEQTAARYKERISGIYESRKMREVKASIGRKVKRLDAMLRKPTEKKHINKILEKSIAELLQQINFETDNQKESTILKLRDLRAEYEKIAKVSDEEGIQATADPYIMEALEMLNNKRLTDMNLEELEILNNIVGYFEHMVQGYNKAFLNGKWQDISDKAQGILMDLRTDTPHTESAYGAINSFKDMMKWGMLTPQMYFERMGDTFYSMYNDFRDALDVKISNTKVAQDYMQELLKNSKDSIKEWTGSKTKATEFRVAGGTIELTPSQVMSLYMLLKREQARGHIFGLGIKASPIEYKKDGKGVKRIKKQFEPVKIAPEDAVKIISTLSKEQRRIAEGIGKFLNTQSKQWVNEATLKNYGYELAKEENYFPIKTDRDFLKSDFDNTNLDPTFTSMGFLKSTVKGAGNAIIIEDIFDVYTEHADKSATYNAFLTVTETTKKIINFKTKQESIKQSMSRKYGNEAFTYLKKFMVDLQGGVKTEGGPVWSNYLIKTAKRTVLGLNMRTIVQQPTAIIRASALIDVDYLMKGIAMKSDKEEMLAHSPIALWKSWGYFNLDTGRTMKDIILDSTPILDKQYIPIQIADDITWTKIWNAVKLEIKDTNPALKEGSKEYYEAVNDRFSNIIDRTQVVDTVMHRSDIMRQKDSGWKVLTSFMAEPTKSYNLLLNAKEKYENDKTEDNKKAMLRTTAAWMATTAVNTFIISLVDMWRRDDKDKESLLNKWLDNILNDITGMVPMVRDIYSLLQGYSIKRMEYNGIEKVARAAGRTGDYVLEAVNGEKHKYPLRLLTKDWIESVSYVFGVSTANVTREIEAILKNYIRFTENDKGLANDVYEFMFKK